MALLIVSACEKSDERFPKFNEGQIVYSVLNGQKGQIINFKRVYNGSFIYNVRFAQNQSETNTSVFGDGPIGEIMHSSFWMREFELKQ